MNKKMLLGLAQFVFGIVPLAAIVIQLSIHVSSGYSIINFFSYFTNLANIMSAVVMLTGSYLTLRGMQSQVFAIVRGASVVYMAVVGVVFALLLRNEDLGALLPWINTILHYVMPIVAVLFWAVYPPASKITSKAILLWLVPPLVYLVYSLARGHFVDWYPYFFINPSLSGGYGGVALYSILVLLFFGFFGLFVWKIAGRRMAR